MALRVDDAGLWLPAGAGGGYDVYFDDRHVWSFRVEDGNDDPRLVTWPAALRRWLDGHARIAVRGGGETRYDAEVRLGGGDRPIRMVDERGIAIMVDKWGLVQRPFSGRPDGLVSQLVGVAERVIGVLAEELGLHAWLAFGSLLGAVRDGRVIPHDSDIDLAYLSPAGSISGTIREMYDVTRALRAAGLTVLNKSGGFVTILFTGQDGGPASVDLYSFFRVGPNLYGTATLGTPAGIDLIEPLTRIDLEGVPLPAPADPDAMLRLSYGPGWRVPDPSFEHTPSPAVAARFDGWFGSLMVQRRRWERLARSGQGTVGAGPSSFGCWALDGLEPGTSILEVGAGTGRDAVAAARAGHRVRALDYARGTFAEARRIRAAEGLDLRLDSVNLLSWRDTVTAAVQAVHDQIPRLVLAAGLLDSIGPAERINFYRMLELVLGANGGEARLEFAHDLSRWEPDPVSGGTRFEVRADEVGDELARLGGTVTWTRQLPADPSAAGMALTRMTVRWG